MRAAVAEIRQVPVAAAIAFGVGMVELTNTGGDGAPPAPIDTGELRSSPRATINSPSTETSSRPYSLVQGSDVRRAAQLGGMTLGDNHYITWIAAHANIIEGGRRIGSHGRMLGSEQAPDGWVWPGVEVMSLRMDSWRYGQ